MTDELHDWGRLVGKTVAEVRAGEDDWLDRDIEVRFTDGTVCVLGSYEDISVTWMSIAEIEEENRREKERERERRRREIEGSLRLCDQLERQAADGFTGAREQLSRWARGVDTHFSPELQAKARAALERHGLEVFTS